MDNLSKNAMEKTGISIKSLKQPVEQLSGGQKHAVVIARTVYVSGTPRVILMDEPTVGLGVKESNKLLEIIGSNGFQSNDCTYESPIWSLPF